MTVELYWETWFSSYLMLFVSQVFLVAFHGWVHYGCLLIFGLEYGCVVW